MRLNILQWNKQDWNCDGHKWVIATLRCFNLWLWKCPFLVIWAASNQTCHISPAFLSHPLNYRRKPPSSFSSDLWILPTVSARLWSIFTYISKSLFFSLLLLLFRVIFFSCETLIYFLFFAALTFVLSSVWVVLGFYPRFFLNGCSSSLDEGVSGAGPQRSFLHVENASFVVSWITTTWIPRWRCSLLLEWRFCFYPNLWAINTTSSWCVHNLVHNYFIDVKCLM